MKTNTDKTLIVELAPTDSAAINGGRRGADDPPGDNRGRGRGRGADDPQPHQ